MHTERSRAIGENLNGDLEAIRGSLLRHRPRGGLPHPVELSHGSFTPHSGQFALVALDKS